jgi:hypothetical protein
MGRKSNAVQSDDTNNQAVVQPAPEVTYPTTEELIASGFTTKSARIRELHRLGMKTGAIAKQETGGLYQHAYNVINKPLKRPAAASAPAEANQEAPAESNDA